MVVLAAQETAAPSVPLYMRSSTCPSAPLCSQASSPASRSDGTPEQLQSPACRLALRGNGTNDCSDQAGDSRLTFYLLNIVPADC